MKLKIFLILAAALVFLSGCGSKDVIQSTTLLDHENQEVTFPQDKPVLFFFITTYT
jgi:hypothetical protein